MLRFSDPSNPGIGRKRIGRGWAYFDASGNRITGRAEIDRLNAIGLPPAYANAWFCPDPDGHIQATGTDARGRRQYRYHRDFRARRDKSKYADCLEFGQALPKIRRMVDQDLRRHALGKRRVVAAVVRLLDEEMIRVGSPKYARDNKSYGATTLLSRHLRQSGDKLKMRFAGKSGIIQELTITDRRLARIVRRCQDLPGQLLFQYLDEDGEPQPVTSADVNDYIREASSGAFTAKHFRTWGASVIAFEQLLRKEEDKRISVETMIEPAAEALGNTPAMSRKAYVHPSLIEATKEHPRDPLGGMNRPRARKWLTSAEVGFLQFLKKRKRRRRPKTDA